MADTSFFDKFFSVDNNPAIQSLKGLPSATLDYLSGLDADTLEYLESLERDNTIPLTMKDQIGQRFRNILPDFVNLGLDTGENIKTSIDEFLSGDSSIVAGLQDGTISEGDVNLDGVDLVQVLGDNLQTNMFPEELINVGPNQRPVLDPSGEGRIKARPTTMGEFELTGKNLEPYNPIGGLQTIDPELQSEAFGDLEFELEKEKQRKIDAENFRKQEEKLTQGGLNSMTIAESKGIKTAPVIEEKVNPEDGFAAAMKDFLSTSGKEPSSSKETKEEALERYKKEFSDATGEDVSGKVSNKTFLMSLGLKLLQNKAGNDFSKILSETGRAVEESMPYLEKATATARTARISAGNYALGQIKAGESAAAAISAENTAFQRERYLKLLGIESDIEQEKIKAGAKVGEIKNVKVDKVINGLEVQRGRGATGAVFVYPEDALRDSSGALNSVNGALATVDQMTELLTQINSEDSPTFQIIADSVNTALVGAGFKDANVVFGDSKVGKRQQVRLLQDSIVTQFKRMLTQETGNGISKSDVDNIKLMLGDIDLLGNPEESILRLKEIKTLFSGKRNAIRGVLDELQNPDSYPTIDEYEYNMKLYPSLIKGSMQYSVNKSGNSSVVDVKDE